MTSLEGRDARGLTPADLPDPPGLITCDVSFIPLRLVLPHVLGLAAPEADAVILVKPQFEAGRDKVRKGLVRDPAVHVAVCDAVAQQLRGLGWRPTAPIESPIPGGDGNREFLIGAQRG